MSIEHTVWSLDKKKPLAGAALKDEKELELLLLKNIEILNKDWLVIGNQVKTDAGKFIDLLCMDRAGKIIVVELKKDLTPREVTAQVIDYAASVSSLLTEDIAQIYLNYSKGSMNLNQAYRKQFGSELEEVSVNQDDVKMVIVAAQMDAGTERIIHFLKNTYQVDINILFFEVFECDGQRLISRAWFQEDEEESMSSSKSTKNTWNGEYYVSYGVFEDGRQWDDAMKYGFISAGHGEWYSRTLKMLSPGDRVWINIPKTGYVGVGSVTDTMEQAKDVRFEIKDKNVAMRDLPLKGEYFQDEDDPIRAEYVVKVQWIKKVPESEAIWEIGFFGNENSVCRPNNDKWDFTIERLKKHWNIK